MDIGALPTQLLAERPHLFSPATVAVAAADIDRMAGVIAAIERVAALTAYRQRVLSWAPEIARHEPGSAGVFFGYDFHLTADGPKLIEINTNAGGGFLAAAQSGNQGVMEAFVAMFRAECRQPLRTLAIVDSTPASQYLYPDFLLCRQLLLEHGVDAVIAEPRELSLCQGGLWYQERRIDLVYNRLTDFALEAADHVVLKQAYLDGSVVLTPHPRAHALYADKRNLVVLGDDGQLAEWGVDAETRACLTGGVPQTEIVAADRAADLWARRRQLFFKPAGGFGAKATYRGDKMTRGVFEQVVAGNYVAQALVPPSLVRLDDGSELKADIRCYAYNGRIQLVAARLWQGQTTNFRTPSGGFARVVTA